MMMVVTRQRDSLEAGDVDVEDEVVVVRASSSAHDVISGHLPACNGPRYMAFIHLFMLHYSPSHSVPDI